MEAYDVFMILVLVVTTIFGAWKGMAWQLASLASLAVSYTVALSFSPQLAPMFGDEEPWNRFLAMLVIYIASSMVIWLLFRIVAGMIDRVKLREFDRQLGALFGLAKGVLICVAITFFAVCLLPEENKHRIIDSQSGHAIVVLLNRTHTVIPDELHDVLHPYLHRIEEKLDPDGKPHERDHAHATDWADSEPPATTERDTSLPDELDETLDEETVVIPKTPDRQASGPADPKTL